jgi:transcriptional regulator with XRE-family HTH domain
MSSALAERLDAITHRAKIRKRDVAELIGTTPETVSRWRTGRVDPQPSHRDLLLQLDWLISELAELYDPPDAHIWLFSPNKLLNGRRPVDLIKERKIDDVLRVIALLKDGAFA